VKIAGIVLLIATLAFASAFGDQAAPKPESPPEIETFEKVLPGGAAVRFFRFDPEKTKVLVAYANPPKTVEEFAIETPALLSVNAGYWDSEYKPTDLLIVDGKTIHSANMKNYHYGLFYVKDTKAAVRDIRIRPIRSGEKFQFALKCGPTLIKTGGKKYVYKSESRHARAAVGRDKKGRIFFAMNRRGRLTYNELSDLLLSEEIGAQYAFNLDGGPSVGYHFRQTDGKVIQRRSQPVSSVIQVSAK
jgi:uncharacterized protein YigE (DUF2233 family)